MRARREIALLKRNLISICTSRNCAQTAGNMYHALLSKLENFTLVGRRQRVQTVYALLAIAPSPEGLALLAAAPLP